jgi:uncharacterized protein YceH (UPF0502 family)
VDADAVEIRVLGCLVEKQRTTPDSYPLSLNGLRLACNQTTNRDPVVAYDEATVRQAVARLSQRGWIRLASGRGSRAVKYRHLLDTALGLSPEELAVLAVLMLRGPQTPGELKGRSERLHPFDGLAAVEDTLASLAARNLAERVPRRPGQKEDRYRQLLGGEDEGGAAVPEQAPAGEQRIAPYLLYEDAEAAIGWLERAFGFREVDRSTGAAGGLHVELSVDEHGTFVYLGQPPSGFRGPADVGSTSLVWVLADDVDAHYERARAAGAEILEELNDAPTGHRRYGCADPQGHQWWFARPLFQAQGREAAAAVSRPRDHP